MFPSSSSHLRSFSTFCRSGLRFSLPLIALAFLASAVQPARAQGTHLWTQSRIEEFEKGTPQGVAISSDGHLREAPGLTEVLTTPSTFVWSVAVDKSGTAYLGTGSPATVLRIGPDDKPFTLFESKDVSVQGLKLGPDGALYAATLPSGKVYKLKSGATTKQDESSATVVFDAAAFDNEAKPAEAKSADGKMSGEKTAETKSGVAHYIWDLAFDASGRLYIATGGPGIIYRVDPAKPKQVPEAFFKTDEAHIRSLAWDAQGDLIAGSDGSGLVYRIGPSGKGYVLFEAPLREITSVAVAADGTIYAASVGDKSRNPLPPLPVQGASSVSFTITQPGSLQAANTSVSVPDGSEIYALTPSADGLAQAPRKLWSGKDEIVYALSAQSDGLIALTGNRGRIFKIQPDGSYADIAHLEAQQGLSLVTTQSKILIGAGNTGKLICLCAAEKHEYASDVLDAGALARFGRVEVAPDSANFELLTRTGNVEQPARGRKDRNAANNDWGWSDWQPLKDGTVASPAGRYLQWKAVLKTNGTLGSVGVNYLPVNAAPVVDELVVVPGARINPQGLQAGASQTVSINFSSPSSTNQNAVNESSSSNPPQATKDRTAITVRWAAHDDNGDELTYALYLRGDGEHVWRLLKDGITDRAYSFDATMIPDGGYQIKVVASDAPSHTPGDALTGAKESERFEVDTTPPVVSNLKATAAGLVTFDAEDAFSPIVRAEYSLNAGPWQFIEPVGGLSDSRREHYEIHLQVRSLNQEPSAKEPENRELKWANSENLITVRAYDRHENIGVAKTVLTLPMNEQAVPVK